MALGKRVRCYRRTRKCIRSSTGRLFRRWSRSLQLSAAKQMCSKRRQRRRECSSHAFKSEILSLFQSARQKNKIVRIQRKRFISRQLCFCGMGARARCALSLSNRHETHLMHNHVPSYSSLRTPGDATKLTDWLAPATVALHERHQRKELNGASKVVYFHEALVSSLLAMFPQFFLCSNKYFLFGFISTLMYKWKLQLSWFELWQENENCRWQR